MYPPIKELMEAFKSSIETLGSLSSKTFPDISKVSVFFPSTKVATYSLLLSVSMSHNFVALPAQTGSTPSASGSKVPV